MAIDSQPEKTVLFVEDSYVSISGIYDEILSDCPTWIPALRDTVETAWEYLCKKPVHAVILDVMLPYVRGVPDRLEGVYLAAWIHGMQPDSRKRAGLGGQILEANECAPTCIFTSRGVTGVKTECEKMGLTIAPASSSSETHPASQIWCFGKDRTDSRDILTWLRGHLR